MNGKQIDVALHERALFIMNPNTIFTTFPELETPRLRLRQLRPSDAPDLFSFFSDDEVTRYFGVETFTVLAQARQRIKAINANFRNRLSIRWGIAIKKTDRLIGSCGYVSWKRPFFHAALGYELARPYWQQGIMTETLTAVLHFGFTHMQLNRIEALVVPMNTASIRLLAKLGFQREGLMREYGYWNGCFHDLIVFSLLKREWATGTPQS